MAEKNAKTYTAPGEPKRPPEAAPPKRPQASSGGSGGPVGPSAPSGGSAGLTGPAGGSAGLTGPAGSAKAPASEAPIVATDEGESESFVGGLIRVAVYGGLAYGAIRLLRAVL